MENLVLAERRISISEFHTADEVNFYVLQYINLGINILLISTDHTPITTVSIRHTLDFENLLQKNYPWSNNIKNSFFFLGKVNFNIKNCSFLLRASFVSKYFFEK